jgi:hypothetical protein
VRRLACALVAEAYFGEQAKQASLCESGGKPPQSIIIFKKPWFELTPGAAAAGYDSAELLGGLILECGGLPPLFLAELAPQKCRSKLRRTKRRQACAVHSLVIIPPNPTPSLHGV